MDFKNTYYFLLMLATLAGPFALSFDKRVAFWKLRKPAFKAILSVAIVFIIWDVLFTHWGVWGFNPKYYLPFFKAPFFNLPLEEVLFFVVVPYAALFSYQCIKVYFNYQFNFWLRISLTLIALLITLPIPYIHNQDMYTFSVGVLSNLLLLYSLVKSPKWLGNFWVSYWSLIIPFFFVNGFLTGSYTDQPIVWYNNLENQGIRIGTIPIEDFFYSFSLIFLNVGLFEWFKKSTTQPTKGLVY